MTIEDGLKVNLSIVSPHLETDDSDEYNGIVICSEIQWMFGERLAADSLPSPTGVGRAGTKKTSEYLLIESSGCDFQDVQPISLPPWPICL